uniref:Uncharacterized protein n=1 Tax=Leersia perrieri TaxID=77586 RepID=A0A0D9WTI6_9ORYZ
MLGGIVPVKLLAATSKTVRLTRPEMSTPVMSPTKLFDRSFESWPIDSGNSPRLHIKKVVRELAGEVVAAGAENAQPRAVAETGGDDPTEQIHGEIKNGDLRAAHAQRRDRAMEAVVAGIQRHEAWRVFPDRGREFPLQEIARHVEQLEREAAAGNGRQWRQLLTSTTVTLDRENTTSGSSPERLFLDRLRYMSSVRLPIDGEIVPASPRPGSHSRVTAPPPPPSHPTPSHVQQSGEPCHSATMPSPAGGAASARNDSNASLSASKHAAARPQREAVGLPWTINLN